MKAAIRSYRQSGIETHTGSDMVDFNKVQLVLAFGARHILGNGNIYDQLRVEFPIADIALCSTSGEIFNNSVLDDMVSITIIEFEKIIVRTASVETGQFDEDNFAAGQALVKDFCLKEELNHIMIFCDGGVVNDSELVNGINTIVKKTVPVTGGLAGDGVEFNSTIVGLNCDPGPGKIIAFAFYGSSLSVAHGSMGQWEMFGPEKIVTFPQGNRLFGINHENALDLYKKYLGPYAKKLPGSALLFLLSVRLLPEAEPVVRTILSIDHASKSMVFAGDVPEGSHVPG